MKTHRNLHEQICSFENLHAAYLDARKGKRYRDEVLAFSASLEENLIIIQNELIHEMYQVGKYREFYVHEPKKRLVMALPFKDRVVQWAIYRVINPIISKGFIYDTYACIPGRGAHSAVQRLQYWMRLVNKQWERPYYLKLDISKYFYRVDHDVLIGIFSRKFRDDKLLRLLMTIIKSEDMPFGLPLGYNPDEGAERLYDKGMPIGNLTSQMFANAYLNELDQYAKRELHIRHYIRYMDDVIILSETKDRLHGYKDDIEQFLGSHLRLNLNNKTAIRPQTAGIEFCGYRVWPTHIKLRKSTSLRVKRKLRILQRRYGRGQIGIDDAKRRLASYHGLLQHCDSYRMRCAIFGEHPVDSPGWFSLHKRIPDETVDE